LEFSKNLLENKIKDTKKDPVTNENVFFFNELYTYENEIQFKLLEYSIVKKTQSVSSHNTLIISGDGLSGNVFFIPLT
jgi:hypothetical protein